jgi:diaminohydroxyphosphoribosylaminopyrimidine deaminase / 5-amino-6-(5-phosphoribosylamino)uracil reductase
MTNHEQFMQRCLDLAAKGLGRVAPNPMVGCVIVQEERIIGEGYHQRYGQAHAEVNAILSVANDEQLKKSTLYVNLEPCSHFGKTPPCADLIISKGIAVVVIGSRDPNPLVAGKGMQKLKAAGIEVLIDILGAEADYLNRRFITFHKKHRPYIILKWAQSGDGFMARDEPQQFWFTSPESKKLTHKWRSEEAAIMVGRSTVEIDDCELTVREWMGENPLRIVIDKEQKLSPDRKIFNGEAKTIVFNQRENIVNGMTSLVKIDFNTDALTQIAKHLYSIDIQSVIIEGGPKTLTHFIEQSLWDEARIFTTKHLLKSGKRSPELTGHVIEDTEVAADRLKIFANMPS